MHSADAAEAEFYAAFAAADLARMRAVWAKTPDCLCIHPGGLPIEGYDSVLASWADILGRSRPVELRCEPVSRVASADTVVSTVYEHFSPPGAEDALAPVLATNLYRRYGREWQMVLHHASPVVTRLPRTSRAEAATRH
ncbi:MAG TPA: nuclear transport factor 2 family protein [Gammaproteobacteria bacterium]|nr:nuclear transport factor 2 family protein [Gammaproteobacteria bacterium]